VVAAARAALERAGDWRPAEELLVHARSDDRFVFAERLGDWPGRPGRLDAWVATSPHSAEAALVRGAHTMHWAWEARGAGPGSSLSDEQATTFLPRLKLTDQELGRAAQLAPADPTPWALRVRVAMAWALPLAERRARFEQAIARAPGHIGAHKLMVHALCGRWSGDSDVMLDFARGVAGAAPPGHPLHVLVAQAHLEYECDLAMKSRLAAVRGYLHRPEVRAELRTSAEQSVLHPAYQPWAGTAVDLSELAYAFSYAQDKEYAAEVFRRLGGVVTEYPWFYGGDPAKQAARHRRWAEPRAATTAPDPAAERVAFEALDGRIRKEVERLARDGRLHRDPGVAAASVQWANSYGRTGLLRAGWAIGGLAAVAIPVSLWLHRPFLIGPAAVAGVIFLKRWRLSRRLLKLAAQRPDRAG
jgi:hypothetical protein